ncbi:GNAT family N-acetyltransferase [Kribbella sp. ALI-6-A]|uniref:GNAT family N-acetyltransferase n=1 Tax=Kribbella sp. ALI-6-A TaxID=1933817 RepID=UPI00097C9E4C|nr:GNAT family N-acetyltransferase [Kribbella sp. ALI-6-A]ONI69570.1 GNAT family N-acetyltransferase [Kribbella sp. ALI-6-A]
MTAALPAGLTVRSAELADAEEIAAQMGAYTSALLGFPQHSPENVADYLRDPAMDLATGSWLVHDGDKLVGSATAVRIADRRQVDVDVFAADPAIAAWLFDTATEGAIDRARADGLPDVRLHFGQLQQDETAARLATAHGFTVTTSIQLMRIEHPTASRPAAARPTPERDSGIELPEPPAGVTLRVGAFDEATKRAAHAVIAGAFDTQPGSAPRPYDDWVASRESRSTFDWSQLAVAELDGEPVGVRECSDTFLSSDNCNYIGRLGVLPQARGRGLAKFLLRDQFARDAAAGLTGTMLHVDSSNPTPAVGLYLGVGMRPTVITAIWEKSIPLAD